MVGVDIVAAMTWYILQLDTCMLERPDVVVSVLRTFFYTGDLYGLWRLGV